MSKRKWDEEKNDDDTLNKCETLNKRPVGAAVDASPDGHSLGTATASASGGVESSDGDSSSGIVADAFDVTFDTATCSSAVHFDGVEVFYFEREQGFGCVPSVGGHTLGMAGTHHTQRRLSLSEHAHELRAQQRARAIRFTNAAVANNSGLTIANNSTGGVGGVVIYRTPHECDQTTLQDGMDVEEDDDEEGEEEEDGETDTDNEHTDATVVDTNTSTNGEGSEQPLPVGDTDDGQVSSDDDDDDDDLCYLQPMTVRERKQLLRAAGIVMDVGERTLCADIRSSRAACGCECTDGVCAPASCACALDGIQCQVDRTGFPCACASAADCANPSGRIEFNAQRVRNHFIGTMLRLRHESHRQFVAASSTSANGGRGAATAWPSASVADQPTTNTTFASSPPYQLSSLYTHQRAITGGDAACSAQDS